MGEEGGLGAGARGHWEVQGVQGKSWEGGEHWDVHTGRLRSPSLLQSCPQSGVRRKRQGPLAPSLTPRNSHPALPSYQEGLHCD